jgi:diacylglycerol diphosphate phosphatase/phosphatidate phosphatase
MATSIVPAPAAGQVVAPGTISEARNSELSVIPEAHEPESIRRPSDLTTRMKPRDPETGPSEVSIVHHRRRDAFIPGFRDNASFADFLRHSWLDVMTMLSCLLLSALIYHFGQPLLPRYFPFYSGIETSAWGLKYGRPYHFEWITTTISAIVSFAVPLFVIGAIGLWGIRRFWETNAAVS